MFLFKKSPNISKYSSLFSFFSIKRFLMLLIMFSSDCFCFFPRPYTACVGVSVLKGLIVLSLKPLALFLIGSGI